MTVRVALERCGRVATRRAARARISLRRSVWRSVLGHCVVCLTAGQLYAATPAGEFRLGDGRMRADVKSWGPDCGPRPGAGRITSAAAYQFTGALLQGGDHPAFTPGACIVSGIPGLRATRSGNRITCKSKPGAPKQIDGRIDLRVIDVNALAVTQRFAFDWRLKGSHCVVTLTTRLELARSEPIVADAPPPPPPEAEAPSAKACDSPGALARLSARGSTRRAVKKGGRVRLSVLGRDAAGCAVAAPVSWSASGGKVKRGVLDVRGVAAGTKLEVKALAGALSVVFEVEVLAEADLAALAADQPELIEGGMAPLPPQAGAGVGATGDGSTDDGGTGRLLLGIFIGFGIVAVGIGLLITRRSIQQRGKSLLDEDMLARYDALTNQPTPIASTMAAPATAPTPPVSDTSRQCPTCDRLFDAGTRFCPFDSAPLDAHATAADEILLTSAGLALGTAVKQERICPHCGARYPADVQFCGLDGARLVLLN